jgi:hypothetical protein
MEKSSIANGQMFLHFNPLTMDKPKVWVKVSDTDDTEPSLFIDNTAFVRFAIDNTSKPSITERWLISDRYYGEMVRKGEFVPLDDLAKCDAITEELGWPAYVVDF